MKTNTTLFWKLAVDYGAVQADNLRRVNRNNNGYGPRETTLEALRLVTSEQTKVGGRPS